MVTRVRKVAKKSSDEKGGEGDKPARKTTVKLSADLHRRARTVASDLGLELSEYLDRVLRPIVDKAYKELGHRISKEGADDKPVKED